MRQHNYFVYIVTNSTKSTLYLGVTNDLSIRIKQHYENRGLQETFAGRYHCCFLVFWEHHTNINFAIEREKEIKKWRREKKDILITQFNSKWRFLNNDIQEC
ncbi:MAG: GIY-YIG nuclease family protein [Sphingobacteriaceae bacterium]|nr:MAG: GIY-YIG nuclease family protein [Sphingobacteriaceae bacterium]